MHTSRPHLAEADLGRQRLVRNVCGWSVDCRFLQLFFLFLVYHRCDNHESEVADPVSAMVIEVAEVP